MKTYVTPNAKLILVNQADILTTSNDATVMRYDSEAHEWLVGGAADWWTK